ncbi:MAG: hypothetical protein KDM64_03190 [Verrucomicrobiae bacterium]|nr:hypothetical protein [Verrucomicrobiae bacterium]
MGTASPQTTNGTNVAATLESGEPTSPGDSRTGTVWWQWTAPGDGYYRFDTFGSDFDTIVGVGIIDGMGNYSELAHNDQAGGTDQSAVTVDCQVGTVYAICVGGWYDSEGQIVLNIAPESPTIIQSIQFNRWILTPTQRTLQVTVQLDDADGIANLWGGFLSPDGNSWVDYEPFSSYPVPPNVGDEFSGSWVLEFNFPPDAEEGVWKLSWFGTEDMGGSLNDWSDSDLRAQGFPTEVVFDDPANGPLLFDITVETRPMVGGLATGGGSFSFHDTANLSATAASGFTFGGWVRETDDSFGEEPAGMSPNLSFPVVGSAIYTALFRPENDDFSQATDLGNSPVISDARGWNAGAGGEVDEPGNVAEWDATSWWRWTSPIDGLVEVDTAGSDFDTVLTVFSGDVLATLEVIGMSHDAEPDKSSRVAFLASAGMTYSFRVHGGRGESGRGGADLADIPGGPGDRR